MTTYHRTKSQIAEEQKQLKAAQKNSRHFAPIYERYYEQLFIFVLKRVSDEDHAADLTSQVFLKAMLNLKKYTFKGLPFSSWLYRIAINEVNMFFRETKKQRAISIESAGLQHMIEEVQFTDNEGDIQLMVAALDQLKPAEVQMVELRYFEKMSFREVAQIYNITENNAKVRMYRILAKMKKWLSTSEHLTD